MLRLRSIFIHFPLSLSLELSTRGIQTFDLDISILETGFPGNAWEKNNSHNLTDSICQSGQINDDVLFIYGERKPTTSHNSHFINFPIIVAQPLRRINQVDVLLNDSVASILEWLRKCFQTGESVE